MAAERSPALQNYPKDWRDVKVRRMSLSAQGAYRAILDDMWADSKDQCSVLDCDPFIAKSLGVSVKEWSTLRKEIQHEVEPLFIEKDGRLYSKRLKAEALKQRNYRKQQSEKGKKSAEKRANHGSTTVPTERQPEGKSSSSSSSSSSSALKSKTKDLVSPPKGDKSVDKSHDRIKKHSGEDVTHISDGIKKFLEKYLPGDMTLVEEKVT